MGCMHEMLVLGEEEKEVNLGGQKRFCVAFLGLGCGNKREEGVK